MADAADATADSFETFYRAQTDRVYRSLALADPTSPGKPSTRP
jgi:hypothetical protein